MKYGTGRSSPGVGGGGGLTLSQTLEDNYANAALQEITAPTRHQDNRTYALQLDERSLIFTRRQQMDNK